MSFLSGLVWPSAGRNVPKIYPTFNLDWTNQAPTTKPELHARVWGNLVLIEGALSKPTSVTDAGKLIATFPNSIIHPAKIHSTGMFEVYQDGTRREWRYQLMPDGRLLASGLVNTGRAVDQAYVHMFYYTDND